MDVSKYVATGNEIKTLGLKLQGIIDPDSVSEQDPMVKRTPKEIDKVSKTFMNSGIIVVGLLTILVIGTFILLHFW